MRRETLGAVLTRLPLWPDSARAESCSNGGAPQLPAGNAKGEKGAVAALQGWALPEAAVIQVQELRVDKDAYRVTVGGDEIALTLLEFKLLVALVEHAERVQSRGALLSKVWGICGTTATRTVDTHVKRLRDKLGSGARFIKSVRDVGYCFTEAPEGPGKWVPASVYSAARSQKVQASRAVALREYLAGQRKGRKRR